MDRRSFLKSLAALGLIPAVDIESLLSQPEAREPAAAELIVDGLTLHPLAITMRHQPIEVTSWNDHERHYSRGWISFDLDLGADEFHGLEKRIGQEVALSLVPPYGQEVIIRVGRAVLSGFGYREEALPGDVRYRVTFEVL